jgi:hypothetical protein
MPHERWGERPKAFVTLKTGAGVTERELIDFCRGQIAHFKCPDAVDFGPLPKTSTGKFKKFAVREGVGGPGAADQLTGSVAGSQSRRRHRRRLFGGSSSDGRSPSPNASRVTCDAPGTPGVNLADARLNASPT